MSRIFSIVGNRMLVSWVFHNCMHIIGLILVQYGNESLLNEDMGTIAIDRGGICYTS